MSVEEFAQAINEFIVSQDIGEVLVTDIETILHKQPVSNQASYLEKLERNFTLFKQLGFDIKNLRAITLVNDSEAWNHQKVLETLVKILQDDQVMNNLSLLIKKKEEVAYTNQNGEQVMGLGIFAVSNISCILHKKINHINKILGVLLANLDSIMQLLLPKGAVGTNPLTGHQITGEGIFKSLNFSNILKDAKSERFPEIIPNMIQNIGNIRLLGQEGHTVIYPTNTVEITALPAQDLASVIHNHRDQDITQVLQYLVDNIDNIISLTLIKNQRFIDKDKRERTAVGGVKRNGFASKYKEQGLRLFDPFLPQAAPSEERTNDPAMGLWQPSGASAAQLPLQPLGHAAPMPSHMLPPIEGSAAPIPPPQLPHYSFNSQGVPYYFLPFVFMPPPMVVAFPNPWGYNLSIQPNIGLAPASANAAAYGHSRGTTRLREDGDPSTDLQNAAKRPAIGSSNQI